MGYGLGVFLLALGLILALAVQDAIDAVDLELIGWILSGAGLLIVVLTAVTLNSRNRTATVSRTTHPDGSQTTQESNRENPPPAI